uniref:hypothetical protein n=1 Tax=Acetatifactor sp. TaxID=1872090 RepID=UPI0040572E7D
MKMKFIDIAVPVIFVLALVIIYFFWGCKLDLYVTVLAGIVVFVTVLTTYVQYKKIKELEEAKEEK